MIEVITFAYQTVRMKNNLEIMQDLFKEVDRESNVIKKLNIIEEFLENHIKDLSEDDKRAVWNKYLEVGGI